MPFWGNEIFRDLVREASQKCPMLGKVVGKGGRLDRGRKGKGENGGQDEQNPELRLL